MIRHEYADGTFRSIVKSIKAPLMEEEEECILMKRENGRGTTVAIPISLLYVFTEDSSEAFTRMQGYCEMMWGAGGWTRGDLRKMAEHIGKRLDDLVNTAPSAGEDKSFARAMEQMGVKISDSDGETLIDYSTTEPKRDIYLGSRPSNKKVH